MIYSFLTLFGIMQDKVKTDIWNVYTDIVKWYICPKINNATHIIKHLWT